MKALTARQLEILSFIRTYSLGNGCPPTLRDCANHFGISLGAVQCHFAALQRKGYLSSADKRSRSVHIIMDEEGYEPPPAVVRIPLFDGVMAGKEFSLEDGCSEYLSLPEPLAKGNSGYFAFKVRDSAMMGMGIIQGDIAIVRQCNDMSSGQVVAVVLDDVMTLRRFLRESCRIKLQGESDDCKSVYCQEDHVMGVLSSIIRNY